MTEYEFYMLALGPDRCNGCDAYEHLGHCGITKHCLVSELRCFIEEVLNWDIDYFLDYIYFEDYILPLIYQEEDS